MPGCSVAFDPVRKRYCQAVEPFRPGEVVLSEDAYECVLSSDECSNYCHHTFTSSTNLLR